MLPRDSDGIKSFQNTRTAFLPFLLHPGAGENSWMCSPRPGSGEKPKMDPGIQHGSSFQHSQLIPTFPGSNSFQREENTECWLLPGIRELLVPSLAKPGEDFPGERLQFSWDNPPEPPIPEGKHSRSSTQPQHCPGLHAKDFREPKVLKTPGIPTFPELQFLLFRVLKKFWKSPLFQGCHSLFSQKEFQRRDLYQKLY